MDACTTRLRLLVADQSKVDEPALRALGARGLVRPSPRDLQVVLGPQADQTAQEIRASLAAPTRGASMGDISGLLKALGGAANLASVQAAASRLRLEVRDPARIDEGALQRLGARGLVWPAPKVAHLILGPGAGALADALSAQLA